MSRIYEALRRANLDRKAHGELENDTTSSPTAGDKDCGDQTPFPLVEMWGGGIARHEWTPSAKFVPCLQGRGVVVEQFRGLRSKLIQARSEHPLKIVLVSSGMPSEGKSFVAINLAMSLARHSRNRVLLIDGDLSKPTQHERLGAPKTPGLAEYLRSEVELPDIIQQYDGDAKTADRNTLSNLTFIAGGVGGENAAELVTNARMEHLIASAAQCFDWILLDSPPVLAVTDSVDMARFADGVLLVARQGFTPYPALQRAEAAFQHARVLGVVLNAAKGVDGQGDYYSYYYAEGEQTENGKSKKVARSKE